VAFVLSRHRPGHDDVALDSIARRLAGELTSSAPLIVRVDLDTTFCWVPTRSDAAVTSPQAPVLVGQGRAALGLAGFRRSHRQAGEAIRVARLADRPSGSLTHFDNVELVALCSSDASASRTFVLEQLGPLAEPSNDAERLRDTLEAFFASNSNFRATALHLGLHHNTIRYRLERIGALLGKPPEDHRLALELALHLAKVLEIHQPAGVTRPSA
jgi:DNA-binding PucR family transcriptional regulator